MFDYCTLSLLGGAWADILRPITDNPAEAPSCDRAGDSLVVYLCDRDPDQVSALLGSMLGPLGRQSESDRQWILQNARYSPMFRFTLTDEEQRLFDLERWCYRGRIDDWIPLSTHDRPLDELAADFLPHLARQSFFELM